MRKKVLCALLAAALLLTLTACGGKRSEPAARVNEPAAPAQTESGAPEPPRSVEARFPLLDTPFSDEETEEMVNHNARCCARLVGTQYFCRSLYADGGCALVRYEIVDSIPRDRVRLVADCPADCLCESGGRLYYLNAAGVPESVGVDGADRREELGEPCRSLQLRGGTLYCLSAEGTLLALRGGGRESVLSGCKWAFVSDRGVFYTAASDGRAHFFDPEARTDMTLTDEAAWTPTVVGTTLFYAADEADGRHLHALELSDGTRRRMEATFEGPLELMQDWDWGWQLRLAALGGAEGQRLLACADAFAASPAVRPVPGDAMRRCRGVHDLLYTDELFSADGAEIGFSLVLPDGREIMSLAAGNLPEK